MRKLKFSYELRDDTSQCCEVLASYVLMTSFSFPFENMSRTRSRTRFYYSKGMFLNYKSFFSQFLSLFFAIAQFFMSILYKDVLDGH